MANKQAMFLVRREVDGTMRTIMATSSRAAVNVYLSQYPAERGEFLLVKLRGEGDWESFEVY